ncbi:MAG: hypothetical protein K9M15_02130 [Candidatus Marinimicrobia bacterium]|nr:hypothetical protein [Candidatus Neomarinimicrobiota bacterium]
MIALQIRQEKKDDTSWTFLVEYDGGEYRLVVDVDYWKKLTKEKMTPIELAKNSFDFLLTKEPKEMILPKFHLSEISQFFPDYEIKISDKIN